MKIRASIHLGEKSSQINLFPVLQETDDHLVLKLAAYLFYFKHALTLETSINNPALQGQEFVPDLLATNEAGELVLWIECGKTTLHKLSKVSRRFHDALLVMLTAEPREGEQMAEGVKAEGIKRMEIWSFAWGEYDRWKALVGERNDVIGEASETSLNLVINDQSYMTELQRIL